MDLIGSAQWAIYKQVINNGHDTFNKETISWLRSKGGIDRNQEDELTETFTNISLFCLAHYNDLRTWPLTEYTETGAIDKESEAMLFNLAYLKGLGYLDGNGNFAFDQDADRIVHRGQKYKCSGITNLSQAQDENLLVMLILQRETKPTETS